jgi:hypothetical protein
LPMFPQLTSEQQSRVVDAIVAFSATKTELETVGPLS